jgi:two-component system cell cycle sensor histidine kinase/response regulator CckA
MRLLDELAYDPWDGTCRDSPGKGGPDRMEPGSKARDVREGTVLLVEDSDVVRDVVVRMLEAGGFTVLTASSGEGALSISREGVQIDLLVTDIVMPEVSGLELADRFSEERPGVPILFMTGFSEEAVDGKGISGGNRGWILKPFTLEEIVARARKILSR